MADMYCSKCGGRMEYHKLEERFEPVQEIWICLNCGERIFTESEEVEEIAELYERDMAGGG